MLAASDSPPLAIQAIPPIEEERKEAGNNEQRRRYLVAHSHNDEDSTTTSSSCCTLKMDNTRSNHEYNVRLENMYSVDNKYCDDDVDLNNKNVKYDEDVDKNNNRRLGQMDIYPIIKDDTTKGGSGSASSSILRNLCNCIYCRYAKRINRSDHCINCTCGNCEKEANNNDGNHDSDYSSLSVSSPLDSFRDYYYGGFIGGANRGDDDRDFNRDFIDFNDEYNTRYDSERIPVSSLTAQLEGGHFPHQRRQQQQQQQQQRHHYRRDEEQCLHHHYEQQQQQLQFQPSEESFDKSAETNSMEYCCSTSYVSSNSDSDSDSNSSGSSNNWNPNNIPIIERPGNPALSPPFLSQPPFPPQPTLASLTYSTRSSRKLRQSLPGPLLSSSSSFNNEESNSSSSSSSASASASASSPSSSPLSLFQALNLDLNLPPMNRIYLPNNVVNINNHVNYNAQQHQQQPLQQQYEMMAQSQINPVTTLQGEQYQPLTSKRVHFKLGNGDIDNNRDSNHWNHGEEQVVGASSNPNFHVFDVNRVMSPLMLPPSSFFERQYIIEAPSSSSYASARELTISTGKSFSLLIHESHDESHESLCRSTCSKSTPPSPPLNLSLVDYELRHLLQTEIASLRSEKQSLLNAFKNIGRTRNATDANDTNNIDSPTLLSLSSLRSELVRTLAVSGGDADDEEFVRVCETLEMIRKENKAKRKRFLEVVRLLKLREKKLDQLMTLTTAGSSNLNNSKRGKRHQKATPSTEHEIKEEETRLEEEEEKEEKVKLEGKWFTLTKPTYVDCLGYNEDGNPLYHLGRMSFEMFHPGNLVCAIQAVFNPIMEVVQTDLTTPDTPFDKASLSGAGSGCPSSIPKALEEEVRRAMNRSSGGGTGSGSDGDGENAAKLRTYHIVTAFTIEPYSPQFGPDSPNRVVHRPIKGIMTTEGYAFPDPNHPSSDRLSVWFAGGKMECGEERGSSGFQVWKRIFGEEEDIKFDYSGSSPSSPASPQRQDWWGNFNWARSIGGGFAGFGGFGGLGGFGGDNLRDVRRRQSRNRNPSRGAPSSSSSSGPSPTSRVHSRHNHQGYYDHHHNHNHLKHDKPSSSHHDHHYDDGIDDHRLLHRPRTFREGAIVLAARLLMGASGYNDKMDERTGEMRYTFTRPMGGHGKVYVDVLYVDERVRVMRGHAGTLYAFARLEGKGAGK